MLNDNIKLIVFDLDGTLTPFDGDALYPDAARYFADHRTTQPVITTNQGGIGLRHWMEVDSFGEPQKYPTLLDFNMRIERLFHSLLVPPLVLMCAAYQSKKTGQWAPTPKDGDRATVWNKSWRKPQPGMLMHAIERTGCAPSQVLMVGDGEEDQQAAKWATCKFQWAWEFFGREKPEGK